MSELIDEMRTSGRHALLVIPAGRRQERLARRAAATIAIGERAVKIHVAGPARPPLGGQAYVLDPEGNVVASAPLSRDGIRARLDALMAMAPPAVGRETYDWEQELRICAMACVRGNARRFVALL